MALILLAYILCGCGTYVLLGKCLMVVSKETNEPLNNKYSKYIIEVLKILFSITWLFSLPYLYYQGRKHSN